MRYRTNELGDYLSFRAEYLVDRPPSILVWISGALGDTILAYPALNALRAWAPSAAITAIGRRAYLGFAVDLGLIGQVEDVDGPAASALFASGRLARFGPAALAVVWSAAQDDLEQHLLAAGVSSVIAPLVLPYMYTLSKNTSFAPVRLQASITLLMTRGHTSAQTL